MMYRVAPKRKNQYMPTTQCFDTCLQVRWLGSCWRLDTGRLLGFCHLWLDGEGNAILCGCRLSCDRHGPAWAQYYVKSAFRSHVHDAALVNLMLAAIQQQDSAHMICRGKVTLPTLSLSGRQATSSGKYHIAAEEFQVFGHLQT